MKSFPLNKNKPMSHFWIIKCISKNNYYQRQSSIKPNRLKTQINDQNFISSVGIKVKIVLYVITEIEFMEYALQFTFSQQHDYSMI